jgi:hypothetical protein
MAQLAHPKSLLIATAFFTMLPLDIVVPAFNLTLMALAKYSLPRVVDALRWLSLPQQPAQSPTSGPMHPAG